MHLNNMSTFIALAQTAAQNISLTATLEVSFGLAVTSALLVLFKPLLRGVGRALLLLVKPKLSKEERLQRRQMRDVMLLNRMLNSMEGSPSHAAELRALASRA
ncbi:MAG: hypothetical protein ACEQSK_05910 [Sphingomonadaceae bacterium]